MFDAATTPAGVPPAGQVSNLIDPPSIASRVTICNSICLVVVVVVVAIRLYTRAFLVRSVGSDDYVNLFALVCWLSCMAMFQYMIKYGLGIHLWNVSVADYSPGFLRAWMVVAILYSTTMLFIKLSILVLYRRLFPIKAFMIPWWAVTILTVGYSIGGICSSLFACTPIESSWDTSITRDHCINVASFYVANGALNSISDLLILALPIPIVWKLSLEFKQKVILSIVFAFGSISCVISIIRLTGIVIFLKGDDTDITYDFVEVTIWSQVELTVAMVCSTVPTLRPFFHLCFGSVLPSESASNRNTSKGPYTRTNEGTSCRTPPYSRYNKGNDLELGVQGKMQTLVSANRADSDTESTDNIIERMPSNTEETIYEENGIMVHTSYTVQSAAPSIRL